jgi:dCTP deaminase
MILSDFDLRNYIREKRLIIEPMADDTIRENGVDLRLGRNIARLKNTGKLFDAHKKMNLKTFYQLEQGEAFILNPDEKMLVSTLEKIQLPNDLMGFVELRSTYARCGLLLPPTILDGGFRGIITLEIRGTSFPIKLYSGDRFAHVVFSKLTSPLEKPYSGKYQGQQGVTLPKFDLK